MQLEEARGEPPLPFFENTKKYPDFANKVPWFWKNVSSFACIYSLNSLLKCSFKSTLEKNHKSFSLRSPSFVSRIWIIYRSAPFPKNTHCPEKLLVGYLLFKFNISQKKTPNLVRLDSLKFSSSRVLAAWKREKWWLWLSDQNLSATYTLSHDV